MRLMIPATAHFVWLGPSFPWFNVLAIRSALARGEFDQVVVHHDHSPQGENWKEILGEPRVQTQRVDVRALCARAGVDSAAYETLLGRLVAPSARSNILRLLVLAAHGGVYLDTDTITVRSLRDLCTAGGFFCGHERIAMPVRWLRSGRVLDRGKAAALIGLRHAFRLYPRGYLGFRFVEGLYPLAANNAVMGSEPGHAFVMQLLEAMLELPADRQCKRFALGTHLLQQQLALEEALDVHVHPPDFFYPLGPEIADHWFRQHSRHELSQVLSPHTRVVHWYGSTHRRRQMQRLSPAYVRARAGRQMLCQLANDVIGDLGIHAPTRPAVESVGDVPFANAVR